jgi:hypothetical protein
MPAIPDNGLDSENDDDGPSASVMVFNANDPSGAGGIAADIQAIASVGAHALPVITGTYARDTAEVYDHYCMDDEAVTEQARAILEDVPVLVFKVGFVGSPENLSAVAELASDYANGVKVVKLNVDENPVTASQYGVRSIPTLLFFREGKLIESLVGALPKQEIEKHLLAIIKTN